MNRKLKFRAWNGKEIFEVAQITFNDAVWDCSKGRGVSMEFQKHITLMQFTGLKDKSGKEIYEGDIIDYGGGRHYPITYEQNGFGIKFKNGHERNWLDLSKFAVVGNIYENPELLKDKIQTQI